jgi:hypothetical protein
MVATFYLVGYILIMTEVWEKVKSIVKIFWGKYYSILKLFYYKCYCDVGHSRRPQNYAGP